MIGTIERKVAHTKFATGFRSTLGKSQDMHRVNLTLNCHCFIRYYLNKGLSESGRQLKMGVLPV